MTVMNYLPQISYQNLSNWDLKLLNIEAKKILMKISLKLQYKDILFNALDPFEKPADLVFNIY